MPRLLLLAFSSRSSTAKNAARRRSLLFFGSSSSSRSTPAAALFSAPRAGFSSSPPSDFFFNAGGSTRKKLPLGTISATATTTFQSRRRQASSSSTTINNNYNNNKNKARRLQTTVHALGEGWTGALGTGSQFLDASIAGHSEQDELDGAVGTPVAVYTTTASTGGGVLSCAAGWGHSALVVREEEEEEENEHQEENENDRVNDTKRKGINSSNNNNNKLLVTGRPHEFLSLLRLRRQPAFVRQYAVDRAYRTTRGRHLETSLHPVDLIGRSIQWMADLFLKKDAHPDWEQAREHSFLTTLTEIPMPNVRANHHATDAAASTTVADEPVAVACSAGVTAVTARSGAVYAFGLNGMGQCGIGTDSNNVWAPAAVTGLSSAFAAAGRPALPQSHPVRQTVLGLQHGLCLNTAGELFSWGKGERGQLGHELGATESKESHTAQPIQRALLEVADDNGKPVYHALGRMSQVSAGMIHSAALEEETNRVFLWGKNLLPLPPDGKPGEGETRGRKIASDARLPFHLKGLPPELKVLQIACGSHHTSFLLEDGSVWAIGLATDTKEPLHEPFCLMEPGMFELPVRQFAAHMDRTTVVTATGEVLQAHVWKEPENREYAIFTPAWVDPLLDACEPGTRIREVHRSWLHTLIVTDRETEE